MATVVGHQNWRKLLFLHWEVPPSALRPLIPGELELDLWEGRAFVGLIPFLCVKTRARFLPPVPGLSDYREINTRTYVRHAETGEPGVWFFALDADNLGAVAGARMGFQLPYFPCAAKLREEWKPGGNVVRYRSARLGPGPRPAELEVDYRVHEPIGTAAVGTIEHYFVERYVLYTNWRPMGVMKASVQHRPYPLHRAELLKLDCDSLSTSLKLPPPAGDVHALYSPGVDVDIQALRRPGD